jgi:hypothetical protein
MRKKIKLSKEIKDDWSKYGDLSEWVREELIRKVKRLEKLELPNRKIWSTPNLIKRKKRKIRRIGYW